MVVVWSADTGVLRSAVRGHEVGYILSRCWSVVCGGKWDAGSVVGQWYGIFEVSGILEVSGIFEVSSMCNQW